MAKAIELIQTAAAERGATSKHLHGNTYRITFINSLEFVGSFDDCLGKLKGYKPA